MSKSKGLRIYNEIARKRENKSKEQFGNRFHSNDLSTHH